MKKILLSIFISAALCSILPAQQLHHILGDVIIQLEPDANIREVVKSLTHFRGTTTNLEIKEELSEPMRIWLLHFDFSKIHEDHFLHQVRNTRGIVNAQFNRLLELRQTTPNDPAFGSQWMWRNEAQTGGLFDADIDLDLAWDLTTGGQTALGQEIVVCVTEGANQLHPDLQGNIWFNDAEIAGNGIDDDGNGYVDDVRGWHVDNNNDQVLDNGFGHGTFISGIIGAVGNNAQYVTGVNWNVKIMHVDFNNSSLTEAKAVKVYTYPLKMRRKFNQTGGQEGAFVVATNSSWGLNEADPNESPIWCAVYDTLGFEGILNCAATTNETVNVDLVGDMPTGCASEYLIAVTATNDEDIREFGGFGVNNIDVGAPGGNVVSINLNGGPVNSSGTSFASPTVAGMVALMYSVPCTALGAQAIGAPRATAEFVRDAIFNGIDKISNLTSEVKYGGRVNANKSTQLLMQNCGPCPKPFGITVFDLTDTHAAIEWFSTDATETTTMVFRKVNNIAWDTFKNVTSPVVFDDLKACTNYELRMIDLCGSENSGFTDLIKFKTDGCCEPPKGFSLTDFSATTASLSWQPVLASIGYDILLIGGSNVLAFNGITGTNYELTGLDSCTEYTVQIRTVCQNATTNYGTAIEFKTRGCGTCTDLPYCQANSKDAQEEWIAQVSLNTLNNVSTSDDGYGDFTGLSTDLYTYQSYTINLTPGYAGFGFNEWFNVYIDFNQDGDFDDEDEEVFNAGETSNDPVQGIIYVPGNAIPGSTRMRVIMKWNGEPSPCEVIEHGEIEDYCVNIIEGSPIVCDAPTDLTVFNVDTLTADFTWVGVVDALSYEVRLQPNNSNSWTIISTQNSEFSAYNLMDCTDYKAQVRTVCTSSKSDWSPITFFTTDCIISTDHEAQVVGDLTISPNPFSSRISVSYQSKTSQPLNVSLLDLNGNILLEQIFQTQIGEGNVEFLGLSQLPSGLYFLKIENGLGKMTVTKLLKI